MVVECDIQGQLREEAVTKMRLFKYHTIGALDGMSAQSALSTRCCPPHA